MASETVEFSQLFSCPQRNGLTRPKRVRGAGLPMVNMGELFSHSRIANIEMDLVPVSDREDPFLLQPGDLLFARQSLVLEGAGKCSIFVENQSPTVFESHIIRCRLDRRKADPNFYYYFFQSPQGRSAIEQIVEQGAGASGIRGSDLARLNVPYPEIGAQRNAVLVLSALDDRIDNLYRINATLEAIAQALFKSWFVDFDPVRAKAEGREPEGMDAATAALFPSELPESEMEPVPAGWNTGTLAGLSDLNASKWNARNHPVSVRYIDLGGVRNNRIDPPSELPFSEAPSRARHHLREGDTIVGTVRPGNRAFAYIHQPKENLTGSTGFAVLSPQSPEASSFVYLAATCDPAIERLANLADGAAYPAVRPAVVSDTPCVMPSENVMKAFSGLTKPLLERISQNSITMHTLANLRDTLLPRLISGKLRLPDAQREIEAATA